MAFLSAAIHVVWETNDLDLADSYHEVYRMIGALGTTSELVEESCDILDAAYNVKAGYLRSTAVARVKDVMQTKVDQWEQTQLWRECVIADADKRAS